MMKHLLLSIGLGLVATSAYASCEDLAKGFGDVVPNHSDANLNVGQDYDAILERGFMTFAVYEDFAPYSWKEQSEPRGIDIEIARAIADEIGVEARFNFFAADENVDADFRNHVWKGPLIDGQVSNIMMHAPYNKDLQCRNEFVVLGGQYMNETLATAYSAMSFPDGAPTTPYFRFHKVGVENHTISAFYLENFNGGMLLPNIVHYPSHEAAFAGIEAGEVDAVLGVKGKLEFLDISDKIEVGTPPLVNFALNEWTIGIAVNFRYREVFYTASGVIEEMIADGRMRALFEAYNVTWIEPNY